jgi:hypothetical protein
MLCHSLKLEKVTRYLPYIGKPFAAAGLMGLVVYFFHVQSFMKLVWVILVGALTYGVLLFAFKGLGKYDIKVFLEFVLRKKRESKTSI